MALALLLCTAAPSAAQDADPPPGWNGSLAVGVALTSGNTDTSTFNVSYDVGRDTGGRLTLTSSGLLIRGSKDGELTVDKSSLDARADYRLADGISVFGQTSYLRDRFKEIEALVAPTLGVAYQVVETPRTSFAVDSSLGLVFERNTGRLARTDGALAAGETFAFKVSDNATLSHGATGLWKLADLGDALYTLNVGITASITDRTELKAELQDQYKSRPPTLGLVKNDVSILLSFVYKF
ncbi:MAG: YdiY family protein [Vicinamibacterales bacterium]